LKPKQQSPLAFREKDGHPSKAGEEMIVAFREKMASDPSKACVWRGGDREFIDIGAK
jgi:hypothetical protein